jgi:NAD(P)-dependent dehydrogenase (short-subunit alcohol dehydrogenase family)
MDLGLKNKVVIITDGVSPIGAAIAEGFAEEGATVVFAGAAGDKIERTKKSLGKHPVKTLGIVADVGNAGDTQKIVSEALATFGRIDVVVNNAGSELYGETADVTSDQLADLMRIKVLAPWEMARTVAPHMKKQGSGRFITLISDAAKIPGRGMTAAAVCGGAQLTFVKSLSDELAPSNVIATAVLAGHIKDFDGEAPPVKRHPYLSRSLEQHESGWAMDVPLGRWGTPQDVANAVVFLASDGAGFIVGSNLDVDGGDQRSIF